MSTSGEHDHSTEEIVIIASQVSQTRSVKVLDIDQFSNISCMSAQLVQATLFPQPYIYAFVIQ